ncbi:MAG: hypothetical protein QXS38_01955 [Candidatus Pacearchaeota archaeon]
MNKRGLYIIVFATILMVFLGNFVIAAVNDSTTTTDTDKINKAYKCLNDRIEETETLSLNEAIFSILALGSKGNLVNVIESNKESSATCWPRGGCKIKETAQVGLAYKRIGKDSTSIKNWLLQRNATASELKWLLEIDITSKLAANCTINDGIKDNKIKILDNGKIQGAPGSCFSIDTNGYMLRLNNNCLGKEFIISCDQDFITSMLYQRTSGGTLFILPETQSAASMGQTKEKASGDCFRSGNTCDYEGTLWAALALQKMGEDISRFTPYLLALAEDNIRYFPSAFLYMLVGGEDQYNLIIQAQKQGKFWEVGGNRYYDTGLAMMSLSNRGGVEIDATKDYLLSIQTKEGCWNNNNIRDSAFILYSGWPKTVAAVGPIGNPCETPFSCEIAFECTQAGGTIMYELECPNAGEQCCSKKIEKQSCSQKGGIICPSGTECPSTGRIESSSDGPCCIGAGVCTPIIQLEDTCTPAGGICRLACESGEEESFESCSMNDEVCCMKKGSSLWFWIILLIILIVLVVLAIWKRDKVKMWWFRFREWLKTKVGKKPSQPPAGARVPGTPFAPPVRQMMPRQVMMQPQAQVRPFVKDKEMEEALRKLREMSGRK